LQFTYISYANHAMRCGIKLIQILKNKGQSHLFINDILPDL